MTGLDSCHYIIAATAGLPYVEITSASGQFNDDNVKIHFVEYVPTGDEEMPDKTNDIYFMDNYDAYLQGTLGYFFEYDFDFGNSMDPYALKFADATDKAARKSIMSGEDIAHEVKRYDDVL